MSIISDGGSVDSTNVINGTGAVGAVKVRVNISHPFRGDLEIMLIHPDGTLVLLKEADINDDGQNWVAAYSTIDGTGDALAPLLGKPLGGSWRLRVRDAFSDDAGTLNSWSLGVGPAPARSDDFGDYAYTNLFPGSFTVQPERDGF